MPLLQKEGELDSHLVPEAAGRVPVPPMRRHLQYLPLPPGVCVRPAGGVRGRGHLLFPPVCAGRRGSVHLPAGAAALCALFPAEPVSGVSGQACDQAGAPGGGKTGPAGAGAPPPGREPGVCRWRRVPVPRGLRSPAGGCAGFPSPGGGEQGPADHGAAQPGSNLRTPAGAAGPPDAAGPASPGGGRSGFPPSRGRGAGGLTASKAA